MAPHAKEVTVLEDTDASDLGEAIGTYLAGDVGKEEVTIVHDGTNFVAIIIAENYSP